MKALPTLSQLPELFGSRTMTPLSLLDACLYNIEKNRDLNAFITVRDTPDLEAECRQSTERWISNTPKSPYDGTLYSLKDNIAYKNTMFTNGSKLLENVVAPYTATCAQRLEEQGMICIGKTNMQEFAIGGTGANPWFGDCLTRLGAENERAALTPAGGSSGGSAVSVQKNMCIFSLGTDTGGSVRIPAAVCGVHGYKPSYAHISRHGVTEYASSFDTVGILAKCMQDIQIVYGVLKGSDCKDMSTAECRYADKEVRKIGIVDEMFTREVPVSVIECFERVCSALCGEYEVCGVSLPGFDSALPAYDIVSGVEAASNLARYTGIYYGARKGSVNATRSAYFTEEVKEKILYGMVHSASEVESLYVKSANAIRGLKKEMQCIFEKVDVILSPTLGYDDATEYKLLLDRYTVLANVCRLPSISIPMLSIGEQGGEGLLLTGDEGNDERVLEAACIIQSMFNK